MAEFNLKILSADEPFYEGPCTSLQVPTTEGLIGIMANRANMIAAMVPGELKYRIGEGTPFVSVIVATGIVKVENNTVTILALAAEKPEDVDANRAAEDAREAQALLKSKLSRHEYEATAAKLDRALNRVNASKHFSGMDQKTNQATKQL